MAALPPERNSPYFALTAFGIGFVIVAVWHQLVDYSDGPCRRMRLA
jgi:hypothetical protein